MESIVAGHMIRRVRLTNGGTCFADVQAKNGGPDPGINRRIRCPCASSAMLLNACGGTLAGRAGITEVGARGSRARSATGRTAEKGAIAPTNAPGIWAPGPPRGSRRSASNESHGSAGNGTIAKVWCFLHERHLSAKFRGPARRNIPDGSARRRALSVNRIRPETRTRTRAQLGRQVPSQS